MKDQGRRSTTKARAESSNKARAESSTQELNSFVAADRWLEHMEEEIEPSCLIAEKDDLNLVLKNSTDDFEILESLKRVRAVVKSSDDVALPESGHYYDTLHSKIMSAIEDDIAMNGEPVREKPRTRPPFHFSSQLLSLRVPKAVFGALGMTLMMFVLAFVGLANRAPSQEGQQIASNSQREAIVEENFERKIAMVDSHSSATFAREMGSFESEEDFLTETAAARLKQVSAQQADTLLRTLTR